MTITNIRLQEKHPVVIGGLTKALPACNLSISSTSGENSYLLKKAVGLGPPSLISVVEGFDINGIPILDSVAANGRELGFRIGLSPKPGHYVHDLREALYKYISRPLLISFMNESIVVAQVDGYIREYNAEMFSNQPEIELLVTCELGYFTSPLALAVPLASLNTLTPVINYDEGTAPTGFDMQFTVTVAHNNFKIFNHARTWYSGAIVPSNKFEITYSFLVGDVVTVSTQANARAINLLRSSVNYDISGNLNAGAVWPKLYTGVNTFEWDLDSVWMTIDFARYNPKFWGI